MMKEKEVDMSGVQKWRLQAAKMCDVWADKLYCWSYAYTRPCIPQKDGSNAVIPPSGRSHFTWPNEHGAPLKEINDLLKTDVGFFNYANTQVFPQLKAIDFQAIDAPAQIGEIGMRFGRLRDALAEMRGAETIKTDAIANAPTLSETDQSLADLIHKCPGIQRKALAESAHLGEDAVGKRMAKRGILFGLGFRQKTGQKGYFPPE
jgi:hypothetical protein